MGRRDRDDRTRDRGKRAPRTVTHSEDTLFTVYKALAEAGITGQVAEGAVNAMQNNGILFREAGDKANAAGDALTEISEIKVIEHTAEEMLPLFMGDKQIGQIYFSDDGGLIGEVEDKRLVGLLKELFGSEMTMIHFVGRTSMTPEAAKSLFKEFNE